MLKQRVESIEKRLGNLRTDKENVERIYQFFLTGHENLLAENLTIREVRLAARKTKENGLKKCPGLLNVFHALLEEEEIIDDEETLFDYIENKVNDPKKLKFQFLRRHGKKANALLGKLGFFKIVQFDFGGTENDGQN